MGYQTEVQRPDAVRRGSMKVEVGLSLGTLINLGAIKDVVIQEEWELVKTIGGNTGEIKRNIKNHTVKIGFSWQEYDLEAANTIRGGLDDYDEIAGALVEGATQLVVAGTWEFNKFIKIENQNGDGSIITVNSLVGSTNAVLVEDTDYYVGQNDKGEWGIFIIDSETITTDNQNMTIDYDYTPNAAKQLTTGGATQIDYNVMRLTNTNEDGKIYQVTIYKAANASGIVFNLPNDDDDEEWNTPINIEGVCDGTRSVKDQLMKIYDEQSVA